MSKAKLGGASATILEIDDEAEDSVLGTSQFKLLPAERRTAESLVDARYKFTILGPLQKFGSHNVVIVLDLMFPQEQNPSDGIAFIRDIRSGQLEIDYRTPIVVHSNVTNKNRIDEALAAGANEFFKKTDEPGELLDSISFFLGKEKLLHSATWEVIGVLSEARKVRIRTGLVDGRRIEQSVDFNLCPIEARIEGGSFLAQTFKKFRDYQTEVIVRSMPVDPEVERRSIERILNVKVDL
ncbi:MAG TPA: hypothetical protein VF173_37655 [Thermoanaerobaculia bacterium]|nr:hypothetical protein [Thermoanaerobaculia bacterium]